MAIERGLADWARDLDTHLRASAAGRADAELGTLLAQQVETYAKTWVDDHDGASKDAANKAAVRHMLALFGQTCRRGITDGLQTAAGTSSAETEAAIAPWLHGIDLVAQAETQLDANVAVALLLDNLVVQFSTQTAAGTGHRR